MDAASALSLYSYQSTLTGTGSSTSAVLQALTAAYSASTGGLLGSDALSSAAGSASAMPALVGGIYTAAVANGMSTSDLSSALSGLLGTDASSSTASLLGSLGTSGLQGLSSAALDPASTLALAAYTSQQSGTPTTLTAAANQVLAGTDTSSASAIQSLLASVQAGTFTSTLSLLG